jgi:hypothetical protein
MGSSGLDGPRNGPVGSVAHWLLQHARVPVTLVRRPEPESEADVESESDAGEG